MPEIVERLSYYVSRSHAFAVSWRRLHLLCLLHIELEP